MDLTHPNPHRLDGVVVIDGRWVAPEASTCNFEEGARHGNQLRKQTPPVRFRTSRRW